jgi:hypothetical protein
LSEEKLATFLRPPAQDIAKPEKGKRSKGRILPHKTYQNERKKDTFRNAKGSLSHSHSIGGFAILRSKSATR